IRVAGGTLGAAVPRPVVASAVGIALAVRVIVLFVVREKIPQGESIVHGRKIDARPRSSPVAIEKRWRGAKPFGEGHNRRLPSPKIANRVTELVVPFGPARGKLPDPIPAGTAIPRLRNKLYGPKQRVLAAGFQEPALVV